MVPTPRYTYPRQNVSWLTRDALLFNLSIGVEPTNLELLHETHPEFRVFPTYATVLGYKGTNQDIVDFTAIQKPTDIILEGVPRFDRSRVVDGEKRIVIHRQLPSSTTGRAFHLQQVLIGLYDKGKVGTIIETETRLVESASGIAYATVTGSVVARGQGDWGGLDDSRPRTRQKLIPEGRPPDYTATRQITQIMPLIYRLNGDYNPLHVDPQTATRLGFDRPILHGLATWNMAAYVVVQTAGCGRVGALQEFQARFSAPVYPADTLTFRIWRIGSGDAGGDEEFKFVAVNQYGKVVLSNGSAVFNRPERSNL